MSLRFPVSDSAFIRRRKKEAAPCASRSGRAERTSPNLLPPSRSAGCAPLTVLCVCVCDIPWKLGSQRMQPWMSEREVLGPLMYHVGEPLGDLDDSIGKTLQVRDLIIQSRTQSHNLI